MIKEKKIEVYKVISFKKYQAGKKKCFTEI